MMDTFVNVKWGLVCLVVALASTTVDGVCRPKVFPTAGGEMNTLQRSVGEIVELNCDVISRNASDSLYWTKKGEVIAFNLVMEENQSQQGKYSVSLTDDIYRLRFKVDANDVGVFTCSCGSSSLNLTLFAAVPIIDINIIASCSNRTADNYKRVISRPASSNEITCHVHDIVNISVTVDGGCTYPGPTRRLKWHWTEEWQANHTTPITSNPKPCFSEAGIDYRYSNVSSLYRIGQQCRSAGNFTLYLDDTAADTKLVTVNCIQCESEQFHPSAIVMIVAGGINLISIITVIAVIARLVRRGKEMRNTKGRCELVAITMVVVIQIVVLILLVTIPTLQSFHFLPPTPRKGCLPVGVEFWIIAIVIVFALIGVFIIVGALGSRKIALGLQDPLGRYRHHRPPQSHRQPRPRALSSSSTGSGIPTVGGNIATTELGMRVTQLGRGPGAGLAALGQRTSAGQLTPDFVHLNPAGFIPERETCGMADEENDTADEDQGGIPAPPPENHDPMPGKTCIVCNDQPVQVCFSACGHTNTCYHCSLQLALDQPFCPVCRKRVRRFSVVYT
ncbi:uncharacterized protein LOC135502286 [Lineus longissimus]|uniref:uncharacterized protein LOC135502286 n=1 Tax=Lineus longissimus TaxID=88925 RepID=UPI002B4EE0AB